jgi:hypothetical protein
VAARYTPQALNGGRLGGLATDVMWEEPFSPDDPVARSGLPLLFLLSLSSACAAKNCVSLQLAAGASFVVRCRSLVSVPLTLRLGFALNPRRFDSASSGEAPEGDRDPSCCGGDGAIV